MEILCSAGVYDFDCKQLWHTHTPWEGRERGGGGRRRRERGERGERGEREERDGREREEREGREGRERGEMGGEGEGGKGGGAEKERTRGERIREKTLNKHKHGFGAANMAGKIFGCVS